MSRYGKINVKTYLVFISFIVLVALSFFFGAQITGFVTYDPSTYITIDINETFSANSVSTFSIDDMFTALQIAGGYNGSGSIEVQLSNGTHNWTVFFVDTTLKLGNRITGFVTGTISNQTEENTTFERISFLPIDEVEEVVIPDYERLPPEAEFAEVIINQAGVDEIALNETVDTILIINDSVGEIKNLAVINQSNELLLLPEPAILDTEEVHDTELSINNFVVNQTNTSVVLNETLEQNVINATQGISLNNSPLLNFTLNESSLSIGIVLNQSNQTLHNQTNASMIAMNSSEEDAASNQTSPLVLQEETFVNESFLPMNTARTESFTFTCDETCSLPRIDKGELIITVKGDISFTLKALAYKVFYPIEQTREFDDQIVFANTTVTYDLNNYFTGTDLSYDLPFTEFNYAVDDNLLTLEINDKLKEHYLFVYATNGYDLFRSNTFTLTVQNETSLVSNVTSDVTENITLNVTADQPAWLVSLLEQYSLGPELVEKIMTSGLEESTLQALVEQFVKKGSARVIVKDKQDNLVIARELVVNTQEPISISGRASVQESVALAQEQPLGQTETFLGKRLERVVEKDLPANLKKNTLYLELGNDMVVNEMNRSAFVEVKQVTESGLSSVQVDEQNLFTLLDSIDADALLIDHVMSVSASESAHLTNTHLVHGLNYSGAGIAVCLIDTGFTPHLFNVSVKNQSNVLDGSSNVSDLHGHGTEVLSVFAEFAPFADYYLVKVLGDDGTGYASDVIAGVERCRNWNVDIISLSLGGGSFAGYCVEDPLALTVNDAVANGSVVFAASGNDGSNSLPTPACAELSIPVGSSTKLDALSSFTNYNDATLLLAPGEDVRVVTQDGSAVTKSGTSLSTPMVAGAAALLQEQAIGDQGAVLNAAAIETRLVQTGEVINASGRSFARLDLYNALTGNYTNNLSRGNVVLELGLVENVTTLAVPAVLSVVLNTTSTYNGTDADLVAYCQFEDSDGDSLWYEYEVYKDGALNTSGRNFSGFCYQETANASNGADGSCDLNYSGGYSSSGSWTNLSNAYDSNWSTYATKISEPAEYFVNYTKPPGATINSVWQLKLSGAQNYSLSSCWNNTNSVYELKLLNDFGIWLTACRDGGSWSTYTFVGSASLHLHEEAMWWQIGENYTENVSVNVVNVSSSDLTVGDDWLVSCRAYDGTSYSSWSNSTLLSIQGQNQIPLVDTISFAGDILFNQLPQEEDINTTISTSDGDGDAVFAMTDWRVDGTSIAYVNMPFDTNVTSTAADAITDYSTHNNDGRLESETSQEPVWTNTDCVVGGCYSYDRNASIDLGDIGDGVFDGAAATFSISMWFKRDRTNVRDVLLSKYDYCLGGQREFIFDLQSANDLRFSWYSTLSQNNIAQFDTTTSFTNTSKWYHVVATYNGSASVANTVKLYVDGVEETPSYSTLGTPTNAGIQNGAAHVGIGHDLQTNGQLCDQAGNIGFDGKIDEVYIFNRTITPQMVTALYNAGLAGTQLEDIPVEEVSPGENWTVQVTPTDGEDEGTTVSDFVLINTLPSIDSVLLEPTPSYGYTTDNLSLTVTTTGEGDPMDIVDWRVDGTSIAYMNMPFDTRVTSTAIGAIRDYSTRGNNATYGSVYYGTSPDWSADCVIGGCYDFNGNGDGLRVATSSDFDVNDFSIELWFRKEGNEISLDWGGLLSRWNNGCQTIWSLGVYNNGSLRFDLGDSSGCDPMNSTLVSPALDDNTWYHVVAVKNGTYNAIYINGVLNVSDTHASSILRDRGAAVMIGSRWDGGKPEYNFNGKIDEVKFYPYPLSADVIASHYAQQSAGLPITTVLSSETTEAEKWTANVVISDGFNESAATLSGPQTIQAVLWNGSTAGPLDGYTNVSAAYALRALSSSYTGPLIQVRRDSDNAQHYIFAVENGDLNTSLLMDFVGTDSAYVTTWFDQSGNGQHLTQSSTSHQPRIVNAGTLETFNGEVAVNFQSSDYLTNTSFSEAIIDGFFVGTYTSNTYNPIFTSGGGWVGRKPDGGPDGFQLYPSSGNQVGFANDGGGDYVTYFSFANASTIMNSKNRSIVYGSPSGSFYDGLSAGGTFELGRAQGSIYYLGTMTELVLFDDEVNVTNKFGLLNDQNAHYNFYWNGSTTGILDMYSAWQAVSLRSLNSAHTNPLVRVRRASDNFTIDVYAWANGSIDRDILETFAEGGAAFATDLYDQSGNNRHLNTSSTGVQPDIVNMSGEYLGHLLFDTNDILKYTAADGSNLYTPHSLYAVFNRLGNQGEFYRTGSALFTSGGYGFGELGNTDRLSMYVVNPDSFFADEGEQGTRTKIHEVYSNTNNSGADWEYGEIYIDGLSYATTLDMSDTGGYTIPNKQTWVGVDLAMEFNELILMSADRRTNRSAIYTNLNEYYQLQWSGATAAPLDGYTIGPAYGLRALRSDYTGPLVRLRRSTDNAEQDFFAQYNGSFNQDDVTAFADGGSVYVVAFYDQSGNGWDANQSTSSLQPELVVDYTATGEAGIDFTDAALVIPDAAAYNVSGQSAVTVYANAGLNSSGYGTLVELQTTGSTPKFELEIESDSDVYAAARSQASDVAQNVNATTQNFALLRTIFGIFDPGNNNSFIYIDANHKANDTSETYGLSMFAGNEGAIDQNVIGASSTSYPSSNYTGIITEVAFIYEGLSVSNMTTLSEGLADTYNLCTANSECSSDEYCSSAGYCKPDLADGATCVGVTASGTGSDEDSACTSGYCDNDGVAAADDNWCFTPLETPGNGTSEATAGYSCKSLLDYGHSTGDGVYWVKPNGTAFQVYCDMTYDGGGWMLLDNFASTASGDTDVYEHAIGGAFITGLTSLTSAGYTSYLKHIEFASYTRTAGYLQMFYSSSPSGYIQKVLPNYTDEVYVKWGNWYSSTAYLKIGGSTVDTIGPNGGADTYQGIYSSGDLIRFEEQGASIVWPGEVWVRESNTTYGYYYDGEEPLYCEYSTGGGDVLSDELAHTTCVASTAYVDSYCNYITDTDSSQQLCDCVAGVNLWNLGGETNASVCCYGASENKVATLNHSSMDGSIGDTIACCDLATDCAVGNSCYASGSAATDHDGDGDVDYCASSIIYDCNIDTHCALEYYCSSNDCLPTSIALDFVDPTPANASRQAFHKNITINVSVTGIGGNIDSCILDWDGVNESMIKVGSGTSVSCFTSKKLIEGATHNYRVWVNNTRVLYNSTPLRQVTGNTLPKVSNVILNGGDKAVLGFKNISLTHSATDANNDAITNHTDWRLNGTSVAVLNMPFNINHTETTTNLITDYSSYGNDGTLAASVGSNLPTWQDSSNCVVGGCYYFDGTDELVIADDASLDITGDFTLSAWIYSDNVDQENNAGILSKDEAGGFGNYIFAFGTTDIVRFGFRDSANRQSEVSTGNIIEKETWIHFVGVYDASENMLYLYKDGVLNASGSSVGSPEVQATDLIIGNRIAADYEFRGRIDEVKIFDRALSASQIEQIYTSELAGESFTLLVSDETIVGENWTAVVTPNDGYDDGTSVTSTWIEVVPGECAVNADCNTGYECLSNFCFANPGQFIIKDSCTNDRVFIADKRGRIGISGTLTQSCAAPPSTNDFVVETATGVKAWVDRQGNMCLNGTLQEEQSTLTADGNDWLIQNTTGGTQVLIDGTTGNLLLRDNFYESMTFDNLAYRGPYLLDEFPGAEVAYSLRLLDKDYTGPLIRVRRSNDSVQKDFYPDCNNVLSLQSLSDDGQTLTAFVGSNSATVPVWYDQSGNARNLTQSTVSGEFRIINAGILESIGGETAMRGVWFPSMPPPYTTSLTLAQPFTVVSSAYLSQTAGVSMLFDKGADNLRLYNPNAATRVTAGVERSITSDTVGGEKLYYVLFNGTTSTIDYNNGAEIIDGNLGTNGFTGTLSYAQRYGGGWYQWRGYHKEFIIWNGSQADNRYQIIDELDEFY